MSNIKFSRRELFAAVLGVQAAAMVGCSRRPLPEQGEMRAPNISLGHRIRDGVSVPAKRMHDVHTVIVGGGIAGLSAAWQLERLGINDFVVLEMESSPGGTSMSESASRIRYPWGAHYVPVPMPENHDLIELLREMEAVTSIDPQGVPTIAEEMLCREPEERVFVDGTWQEGLYPVSGATQKDMQQREAFVDEVYRWVEKRDAQGRRMFAIPSADGSDVADVRELDQKSMSQWMDSHGWDSKRLRWLVEYACRDDYGLSLEQTSAWAGLYYFASRIRGHGADSQPVITWPEGNGRIVDHLARGCGDRLRQGHAVANVTHDDNAITVNGITVGSDTFGYRAKHMIFAAPKFLLPYLVSDVPKNRIETIRSTFQYGSWVVANLHLDRRPKENGFPMCWDNVIYDSKSLGYVNAAHQMGMDHGPTVLTWYYPLLSDDPKLTRKQLLSLDWNHWCDLALGDLEVAHSDIRNLTKRVDVMKWGHAMIQPRPTVVTDANRSQVSQPLGRIHFAGTDLSCIALMEEAFYHGLRAAREVASRL